MAESSVAPNRWRSVEVGRVVVFSSPSPYAGRIAVIVQIIDQKRVLIEGPNEDTAKAVPRHSAPLAKLQLTSITIPKLPRAIGSGPLKKKWGAAGVDDKWKSSVFAQNRERSAKRKSLTDFERFKVLRLKKQRRFEERKALVKIKASA